jgi:hypothetical protein
MVEGESRDIGRRSGSGLHRDVDHFTGAAGLLHCTLGPPDSTQSGVLGANGSHSVRDLDFN